MTEPLTRYRAKPSAVDAVQWTGTPESLAACKVFAADKVAPVYGAQNAKSGEVLLQLRAGKDGAQGWVPVPVGHWLVSQPDDRSDVWPVDPDCFAAKYEPADPVEAARRAASHVDDVVG